MRKWVYKVVSILLSALVLGASADIAFALPKKLPKLKGGKRPRITVPKTPVTRQLPTTPSVRPNVATQVERAVAVQAAKAVTPAPIAPAHALQETPATPAVQDTGTNLTGTQVLAQYFPTWRQELGRMFSNEQLDAVEKAFADTDEWMFVRGADGELNARNKDEWDYEARFLTILQNSGVDFTERQIKQLIGARGMKGFTFNTYFLRMKATGFSCAKGSKPRQAICKDGHTISLKEMTPEEVQEIIIGQGLNKRRNHPVVIAYIQENHLQAEAKTAEEYVALAQQYPTKPRADIYRDGRRLKREEMTPKEMQEVIIGQGLNNYRNHPAVIAYMQENRLRAKAKTAEEYVALASQYDRKPRAEIKRNGHTLKREEMTPEEIQEINIGTGISHHRNHPAIIVYIQENRLHAESKTPEEYVALARQYPTKPRAGISRDGYKLKREEMTPEQVQEVRIGQGLNRHRNHPLVKAYLQENRLRVKSQTTEQLYISLVNHIQDYGHYPLWNEDSPYQNIYDRLRYYESTMTDGKYADPWLQKIYELKTLIQNAPDGKFTLTPDGQGGYTLEIEEPVAEGLDLSAPQKVEEVAPVVPSRHALHKHITEDIKNMILAVRDQAALQRHEFYPWLRDMQQNHLDQIVNKDTSDALWALNRAISFDHKTGQNRRAVTYLLQTVNNYVGILGIDEELGYFNKIMYRGKLEPGMLPQADLFHVVAEQEGMSFDGALAPQVEQLNKLAWQAYKQGQPLSVNFADDDNQNMLTALEIEKGVPIQTIKQDFQTAIQTLLPPGFEVRMGLHELGISGRDMTKFRKGHLHIHLERPATTEEMQDGFLTDVSISFDIKGLGRFVRKYNKNTRTVEPLTDKEIAQNYLTLFGSFLDQSAKDKLTDLAR